MEAALSFQHADRIIEALKNNSGGGWTGHVQGVVYWLTNKVDVVPVRRASTRYGGVSLRDSQSPLGLNGSYTG